MTLTRAFDRLSLSWPLSLLFGAGMGLAFFLSTIDLPLWGFAVLLLSLMPVITIVHRSPLNSAENWDHRDTYSNKTTWLYLIPTLTWIFVVPLFSGSLTAGTIIGVIAFVFCTLLARYSHRLAGATGRKHAQEVLAKDFTVTEEQIDMAREHLEFLSTLHALGAVEGIRVRTRLVAYALNTNATMTLREAREPQATGLIYTSAVDAGSDEGKIFLALTPEGVHALSRATQATPQRA
ncbi:hypothetical protein [Corynebacterium oculi]|uniref:Uncharacterized protein n=1 Tax=Corynebacterium oculi TaxID=1544416 RepID=A0A0Q0Z678_9CORY|nr:hypothetical protein [Corynebacterium oculi]KQB85043.1 hypothetical protein Cocul_00178 [Corynebacterium oculi]